VILQHTRSSLRYRNLISEIQSVIPEKGKFGFSLQVEITDKVYHFHFKHAWECELWMHGLRKAAEVEKEIKRTIHGVIKHNIGILYFYFNSHLDNDIIKIVTNMVNPLTTDLNPVEFANELKKISEELNYFFDAFYAHKPFLFMLFKFVAIHIHTNVKQKVNSYWNKKCKNMNAGEIIGIMNSFALYERTTKSWGMEDSRNNGWINPLLKTFIFKLYDNCRQILANILYDLRNNFNVENHKIVSRSSESLEAHLNFIFDHYNQIQSLEAADLLIETCSTILLLFLINTKNFIRTDNFPLQIYVAVLNNSFLKVIKNFQKRVHNVTNSQISLKKLKEKIDQEFLITTITEIEKLSFNKILSYFKILTEKKFDDGNNLFQFDMLKTLSNLTGEFEVFFNLIDNRFYVNDLNYEIFEHVTNLYYKKFLDFVSSINIKNYKSALNKIMTDINTLEKSLSNTNSEKISNIRFKLKQLTVFVNSEDIDEVIMCVMNMHIFFKELIDPRNVDRMLQAKIFFPPNSIEYISSYLKSSLEEYQKANKIRHNILNVFAVNPHVILFIRNLSKIIRESYSKKKGKRRAQRKYRILC